MFRFVAVFLAAAFATVASSLSGSAADTPGIPEKDIRAAVAKYAGQSDEAPVKDLEKLKETVDLGKLKLGDGLKYSPTKGAAKGSFTWAVPVKKDKKLDNDGKVVVKAFLVGAVKGYAAEKGEPQEVAAALEELALAAEVTDAGGGSGTAVGPAPVPPGKLPLAGLKEEQVRKTVRDYLARKAAKLDGFKDVAYLKTVKQAKYLAYSFSEGKAGFEWKYEPADAALDAADQGRLADALRAVLRDALETEPDADARLDKEGLEAARKASDEAKVTALPYSRIPTLTAEQIQTWVKDYAKTTPPPEAVAAVTPAVDVASDVGVLVYNPEAAKVIWEYQPKSGSPVPAADVREKLVFLLTASAKAAYDGKKDDKKYPAGDLARLEEVFQKGTYTPFAKSGIEDIAKVTEPVVQKMLRTHLESGRNTAALSGAGVLLAGEGDKSALVNGLKYNPADYSFTWTYRPAKSKAELPDPELARLKDALRKTLTEVVRTGGGNVDLRPSDAVFDSYLKSPLLDTKIDPKFAFTLADLETTVIHQMVSRHFDKRRQPRNLATLIAVYDIPTTPVLRYSPKTNAFDEIKLHLSEDRIQRKENLSADQEAAVKTEVRNILLKALVDPVDRAQELASQAEKDELTEAINRAVITVQTVAESQKSLTEIEVERQRLQIRRQEVRIQDLEDDLKALRGRVDELSTSSPGPTVPVGAGYTIQYVPQRTGPLGCRTVMVPVMVPCR